jgi:hypothetical protein
VGKREGNIQLGRESNIKMKLPRNIMGGCGMDSSGLG